VAEYPNGAILGHSPSTYKELRHGKKGGGGQWMYKLTTTKTRSPGREVTVSNTSNG